MRSGPLRASRWMSSTVPSLLPSSTKQIVYARVPRTAAMRAHSGSTFAASFRTGRRMPTRLPLTLSNAMDGRDYCRVWSEDRVDEGRHGAALRQHNQSPEDQQYEHQRQQPELLPGTHVRPQLAEKTHGLDEHLAGHTRHFAVNPLIGLAHSLLQPDGRCPPEFR